MEFLNRNTAKNIALGITMPSIKENILDEINKRAYNGFFDLKVPYLLTRKEVVCLEHLGYEVINGGYNIDDKYALIKWD